MNIRELRESDHDEIRQIHSQFYKDEFDLPDFRNFLAACVVTDDNGAIISVGIARLIVEMISITDKRRPFLQRIAALGNVRDAMGYILRRVGYHQIHAFIQDSRWLAALKKRGFKTCKGEAVYLNL